MLPLHHRPEERKTLRFHLQQGTSINQPGPRRIGKTWLLQKLAEDLRKLGWIVVLADVEGLSRETEFFQELCRQIEASAGLKGRAMGRLRQVLENLGTKDMTQGWQEALRTDWQVFARTLVETLAAQGDKTVLMVDEIALFVSALMKRDADAARTFLYQLRALRQAHPQVRWLFTGSVGLDVVARRGKLTGALLGLEILPLEPFDETAARSFLTHLSASGELQHPFVLDEQGYRHLFDQLGWLAPFYLEHIAKQIRASKPPLASIADIDAAFAKLLTHDYRPYFASWPEHLDKNFPPEESAQLRLILDLCAETAEGMLRDTLLARLGEAPHHLTLAVLRERLDALVQDDILLESDAEDRPRYRFRSGLLRRYWRRYETK